MLHKKLKPGEAVKIGDVTIQVDIRDRRVTLAIDAPRSVQITTVPAVESDKATDRPNI